MLPNDSDKILVSAILGSLAFLFPVQAEPSSQLTVEIDGLRDRQGQISPKFNDAVVLVLGSSTNIQIQLNYF